MIDPPAATVPIASVSRSSDTSLRRYPRAPARGLGDCLVDGCRLRDRPRAQRGAAAVRSATTRAGFRVLPPGRRPADGQRRLGRGPCAAVQGPLYRAAALVGYAASGTAGRREPRPRELRSRARTCVVRRGRGNRPAERGRQPALLAAAPGVAHALVVRAHEQHADRMHCRIHRIPGHGRRQLRDVAACRVARPINHRGAGDCALDEGLSAALYRPRISWRYFASSGWYRPWYARTYRASLVRSAAGSTRRSRVTT